MRADRGGGYVRGYTVYRGEKVLFQDSQNLGSQGSLDMYTLHEVNTKVSSGQSEFFLTASRGLDRLDAARLRAGPAAADWSRITEQLFYSTGALE